jgi:hypothetical protein
VTWGRQKREFVERKLDVEEVDELMKMMFETFFSSLIFSLMAFVFSFEITFF